MKQTQLNWITNYNWGIADDVLRDLYVRGKYRVVIWPMALVRTQTTLRFVCASQLGRSPKYEN